MGLGGFLVSPEFMNFVAVVAACGVSYGGIKSDLKRMHESITANEKKVEHAHDRISDHIQDHAKGNFK